jgi:hypothetical protein
MTRFAQSKDEEMIIQHTTYDDCRGGRSASRRASATITFKIKNYLSKRLSRHLDDHEHIPLLNTSKNTERAGTGWSHFGTSSPAPPSLKQAHATQMTSYLTQQHRIQKDIHKEDKVIKNANSNGSYLPLNDKANKLPIIPRVNGKFVKNRWSRKSVEEEKKQEANIEKLQTLRTAIRDGKMEKVVPPPNEVPFPPRNPFSNPPLAESSHPTKEYSTIKPRVNSRNRNSKSKFTSKKVLATYISNTGDVLDATRREIKEKLLPPLEHLNYPSFSLSRRTSNSSDDSFYCIGEGEAEQEANTKAVRELKACYQESDHYQEPHASGGEKTNFWIFPDDDKKKREKCRLCRNLALDGDEGTGLCQECEKEFERPKTRVFGLELTNNKNGEYEEEEEEEIRPTPPLKDKKIIARKNLKMRFHFEPEEMEMEEMKPTVPRKDEVNKFPRKDVRSHPVLERNFNPERKSSQRAKIEEEGYQYEVYSNQPTKKKEVVVDETTRNVFEKWGRAYGSGDFGNFDKREEYGSVAPLIEKAGREKKKKKSAVSRRSSFYGFWDDVLGEPVSRR